MLSPGNGSGQVDSVSVNDARNGGRKKGRNPMSTLPSQPAVCAPHLKSHSSRRGESVVSSAKWRGANMFTPSQALMCTARHSRIQAKGPASCCSMTNFSRCEARFHSTLHGPLSVLGRGGFARNFLRSAFFIWVGNVPARGWVRMSASACVCIMWV